MRSIELVAPLLACFYLLAGPAAGTIQQVWSVEVGVGEEGGPCNRAAVALSIQDSEGSVLFEHAPSLAPEVLGIAVLEMSVTLPEPGPYVLSARFTRCDGSAVQADPIPIHVSGPDETRAIQIYGTGTPDAWHFEYFGITSEASGDSVFSVEPTEPPTIHNLRDTPLQPCQTSLWPQIEIKELVGNEWRREAGFEFPAATKELAPGASVMLQRPSVIVTRHSPNLEPEPTAYAIVLRVLPPATAYQYFVANPDVEHNEPFPGACDVYFLPYEPKHTSPK